MNAPIMLCRYGLKPSHVVRRLTYVFPTEKYRAAGNRFIPCSHSTDVTQPIGDWKEAWEPAKRRAGRVVSISRPEAYGLHSDAGSGHTSVCRSHDHGVESIHRCENL